MRVMRFVLALAVAALALAWPQSAPAQAGPDAKTYFETMRANVSRISTSLESDRWNANVYLWQVRLDHLDKLEKAETGRMRDSLSAMAAIIAQIRNPDEKERWQLNYDLWNTLLGQAGTPSRAAETTMRVALKEMEANVAKIASPGELERWQANCHLWKATISGATSR